MASTNGWMRLSSRLNRVPNSFVATALNIRPLAIQPVGGDVLAHRIGHQIANRASLADALADERRRDGERRHLDHPLDQGMARRGRTPARAHYDVGAAGQRL